MKKVAVIFLVLIFVFTNYALAEKPTRQYTPVVETEEATIAGTYHAWEIGGSNYDCIVCNGFIISADTAQKATIEASSTIVKLSLSASSPIVSPAGFLWKGTAGEVINLTVGSGDVHLTLTGWEED